MRVSAEDGRVYLPKDIRTRFGTEFELVDRGDRLVLVPLPEDPLAALRSEIETEKSVAELKQSALEAATEEAGR